MAEFTPNFNLEKPDEDEFYNIAYFNENMDIIDKKLKEAGQSEQLESDVTEIKNDIGSAEDLSTSPTIFGKLAEIKETLTTKFADIISKIAGIDSKIGTTTDTGGTSSAASIFAKLNKLLTDWTTTRASRIDSIYANTETSTSSSSTGTLSQKLNYIRTLIGASSDSGTSSIFGKLNKIISNSGYSTKTISFRHTTIDEKSQTISGPGIIDFLQVKRGSDNTTIKLQIDGTVNIDLCTDMFIAESTGSDEAYIVPINIEFQSSAKLSITNQHNYNDDGYIYCIYRN